MRMKFRMDRYTVLIGIALALLLTSSTAYAQVSQNVCGTSTNSVAITYCNDLPFMVLAVLIAFAIAATIFLVGVSLKNDRIKNFGVGEIYEAIASAIIVGLFLYLAWVIVVVIPSFFVGGVDPLTFSLNAISNIEVSAVNTFLTQVYYPYYVNVETIYNAITVWIPNASINFSQPIVTDIGVFIDFFTTLQPLLTIAQFLIDGIYALSVEFYFIQFFAIIAIPAFIAPGVVFRAFLPTRGFGGTLIAMGIGFYVVMPTLFAFSFATVCPGSLQGSTPASGIQSCSSTAAPLPPAVQNLPIGNSSGNGANLIGQYLAPFWLMLLFFPALVLTLTYAFIATVSNFIGASTSMGGRLRTMI